MDNEKSARQRQLQAEIDKENLRQSMDKECGTLRQKISELTTEIEAQQLAREHEDQRKAEQQREQRLHQNEVFAQQERISNSWKRELEQSALAYERVIDKLKRENETQRAELEHWHQQIRTANKARQLRIRARKDDETHHEIIPAAKETFGPEKTEFNNFTI